MDDWADIYGAQMQRILLDIADLAPLEEVAARLARAATELTNAEFGALGVYRDDGHLRRFVTVGISDEERKHIGDPPTGVGLLGEFARSGEVINVASYRDHPSSVGVPEHHPELGPFLGVPVVYGEQVLGAFYVCGRPGSREFTEDDEQHLQALAPYAAIAMSNAITLDRERTRADAASVVAGAANGIQAAVSEDEVCQVLFDALRQLVPDADVLVQLDGDQPCDFDQSGVEGWREELAEVPLEAGVARRVRLGERDFCVADGGLDLPVRIAASVDSETPAVLDDAMRQLCELGSAGIAAGLRREAEASLERYAIRDAIARDLHDDLIQSIYAIGLGLRESTDDPAALRATLRRATDGLSEVIRDLRSYIAQLSSGPDTLVESARLKLRIEALLEGTTPPPRWKHSIDFGDATLEPQMERQLYLIVREAISNVHRHAEAKNATLDLSSDGDTLFLDVRDDGRGYDRQAVPEHAVGLRSIEERVADLGGSLVMESQESEGTVIRATFPIGATP